MIKCLVMLFASSVLVIFLGCKKDDIAKENGGGTPQVELPTVETFPVTEITSTTANCGGNVTNDGGAALTARGVCWSIHQNPDINDSITVHHSGLGSLVSTISGLQPETVYYVRAYATNEKGTAYGEVVNFTTLRQNSVIYGNGVTDIEGNSYASVIIGNQEWMAENLRTEKFNDGTDIEHVTDGAIWKKLSTPAYCWYNNDKETFGTPFGALYNWFTVATGQLCPTGWHVPSDDEWAVLIDFVGGDTIAGLKLKATSGWNNEGNGTDDFGFAALPGGYRYDYDGLFHDNGNNAYGWSSTEKSATHAWYRYMKWSIDDVYRYSDRKKDGYGVRCLKD